MSEINLNNDDDDDDDDDDIQITAQTYYRRAHRSSPIHESRLRMVVVRSTALPLSVDWYSTMDH